MISWMRTFLSQSFQLQSLFSLGTDGALVDKAYKDIYLSFMDCELDQVDDAGDFKSGKDERWYYQRRLAIRDYIQQVFALHKETAMK